MLYPAQLSIAFIRWPSVPFRADEFRSLVQSVDFDFQEYDVFLPVYGV